MNADACAGPDSAGRLGARSMRIDEVRVDCLTIRVGTWPGDRSVPPLLLFNGIGASVELLAPFAEALDDREVVCFDVPGSGGSDAPKFPYRLSMLAVLTSHLLDALGYDRVDVLGVSWGGTIAQQFALQHPRRCRRLILAATAPGVTMVPPRLSVLLKFMTPRRYNDPAYRAEIAGEIYGGKVRTDPSVLKQFHRTRWFGYTLQQFALWGWSSLPWIRLIRQPTLVLSGADDQVVRPVNGRILAWCLPHAQFREVDDGHLFLITSAVEATEVVRNFLDAPTSDLAEQRIPDSDRNSKGLRQQ